MEAKSGGYSSYEQVPWFRKSGVILLGFFVFAPATLYPLFSGDIYYQKKGQLVTYTKTQKIVTIVFCAWVTLAMVVNVVKALT